MRRVLIMSASERSDSDCTTDNSIIHKNAADTTSIGDAPYCRLSYYSTFPPRRQAAAATSIHRQRRRHHIEMTVEKGTMRGRLFTTLVVLLLLLSTLPAVSSAFGPCRHYCARTTTTTNTALYFGVMDCKAHPLCSARFQWQTVAAKSTTGSSSDAVGGSASSTDESEIETTTTTQSANRLLSSESAVPLASFGDVVGLRPNTNANQNAAVASGGGGGAMFEPTRTPGSTVTAGTAVSSDLVIAAQAIRRRNAIGAMTGLVFAVSQWLWQWTHPIEPIQVLVEMQRSSAPITCIGRNDKPTVVDFWAPWCENCKLSAPTIRQLEREYGDDVNFVMVNGDLASSWPLIEAFRVDAIPHLALVAADGTVETALIGPIPKRILKADLDVLIANGRRTPTTTDPNVDVTPTEDSAPPTPERRELPYKMLDVFAGQPDSARRLRFADD